MRRDLVAGESSDSVLGAAIEVHRIVGPGLLESTYEDCLCDELDRRGVVYTRQIPLHLIYKGRDLGARYRMDLVVEEELVVEVKAVAEILPVHISQLMTYLRHSGLEAGLLLNFNVAKLPDGIVRRVLRRNAASD